MTKKTNELQVTPYAWRISDLESGDAVVFRNPDKSAEERARYIVVSRGLVFTDMQAKRTRELAIKAARRSGSNVYIAARPPRDWGNPP